MKAGQIPYRERYLLLFALLGAMALATVRVVPLHETYWQRMLPWLVARSVGLTALVLLTVMVAMGILMSHPLNRTRWRQSKSWLLWHRYLSVFVMALVLVHAGAIVLDRYAHVTIIGAVIPGMAGYRSLPVALGTIALYAMLITAGTASFAQRLPGAAWLKIHRFALVVYVFAWFHGLLAGTDSLSLLWLYAMLGTAVLGAAAWRYWIDVPRARAAVRGEAS